MGYEEGGYLTEHVRRKPYSVVLFDEIEKAHVDVFNVLLQILDDGRLTDGQGRTVDFTNTVVIMTSNIGGALIHETLAQNPDLKSSDSAYEQMEGQVFDALRAHFKPEFLNRVDETIIFHSLRRSDLKQIVEIQLGRVGKYLEERNISLELSDAVKEYLAREGYDPIFGARPLKRLIQRKVLDALATEILQGHVSEGDRVVADMDTAGEGEVMFHAPGRKRRKS